VTAAVSLLLAAALIAGNGLFVGVEFALLASRQTRLIGLAETSRRARVALNAARQLPLMISGCQFGITICSLGLGAVGEPALSHMIKPAVTAARLPEALLHPLAVALSLLVVSALHMVLGEMVPKNIALAGPEPSAVLLAPVLVLFVRVFRPVVVALTAAATWVLRRLGVRPVEEGGTAYTADQIALLIAEARDEGLLGNAEHELLTGALDFQERTAAAVMLPLATVVTVTADVTPAAVEGLVGSTGFSRFPVHRASPTGTGTIDGYVHLADILNVPAGQRDQALDPALIRPLPTVLQAAPLHEALSQLQRTGAHLGRVQDPAGQSVGVIALEDVLEELVGEVRDATSGPGRKPRPAPPES